MNEHIHKILEKKIERTVNALNKNRFDAHYVKNTDELIIKIKEYLKPGMSCSSGGSVTLEETGVIDFLANGEYVFLDRRIGDAEKIQHDTFNCDVYFMSSNAITEQGELYNIDGRGNRVAALAYGPQKVIIIAGANKIVPDITSAKERKNHIAAPANNIRRASKTPCIVTGICSDCSSPERICSLELICSQQFIANRITVFILPQDYGF